MKPNQGEVGDLTAATDAAVITGRLTVEGGHLEGRYVAKCVGPTNPQYYQAMLDMLYGMGIKKDELLNALRRNDDLELIDPDLIEQMIAQASNNPVAAGAMERLRDSEFERRWEDGYSNVITTVGGNDMLDKYLAGSSYTAAMTMFLKGTGTAVIGDTMASHASWLEVGGTNAPAYTGNRPTPAFSAAASKTKQITSAQNFTFTSGGTVAGSCFVSAGSTTKDNTTGILLSAGDFTGGSKVVANTDQINVSWSISI